MTVSGIEKYLHAHVQVLYLCVQRDLDGLAQCLSSANPSSIPKTPVFFGNKKQVVQAYISYEIGPEKSTMLVHTTLH